MNWIWVVLIIFVVIFIIIIIVSVFFLGLGFGSGEEPPPNTGYYYSLTIDGQKRWLAYSEEFLFLSPDKPDYKFFGEVGEPLMYGDILFAPVNGSPVPAINAANTNKSITISEINGKFKMGTAPDCYMYTYIIQERNNYIYMYTESLVELHPSGEWQYQICGEKSIYTTPAKPILVLFDRSSS